MGASSSAVDYAPPAPSVRTQRNETRTLKQLGIELLHDTNVLKEHWVPLVGVPVYVAHRDLGLCQAIAKKTRSVVSVPTHTFFVVRVVNPLFAPGTSDQLGAQHYIVPEQVAHRDGTYEQVLHARELSVVEFRPYGAAPRASDVGAGASYGGADGYVVVLDKLGTRTRISWQEACQLLTIRPDDERLERKLRALARPDVAKNYDDVLKVKEALGELQLICPQTAQYLNTHDTDAAAWGAALDAPIATGRVLVPV